MFSIGDTVELQNGNAALARLIRRTFEIVQCPIGPRITGGGNQQRVIDAGFVGEAAAPFVRMFGGAAAAGEAKAEFLQDRQRVGVNRVAGVAEADRAR